MKHMKIIRVTEEEFELDDGTIQPMMFDLGYVPSVEEFQKLLDESYTKLGIDPDDQ